MDRAPQVQPQVLQQQAQADQRVARPDREERPPRDRAASVRELALVVVVAAAEVGDRDAVRGGRLERRQQRLRAGRELRPRRVGAAAPEDQPVACAHEQLGRDRPLRALQQRDRDPRLVAERAHPLGGGEDDRARLGADVRAAALLPARVVQLQQRVDRRVVERDARRDAFLGEPSGGAARLLAELALAPGEPALVIAVEPDLRRLHHEVGAQPRTAAGPAGGESLGPRLVALDPLEDDAGDRRRRGRERPPDRRAGLVLAAGRRDRSDAVAEAGAEQAVSSWSTTLLPN